MRDGGQQAPAPNRASCGIGEAMVPCPTLARLSEHGIVIAPRRAHRDAKVAPLQQCPQARLSERPQVVRRLKHPVIAAGNCAADQSHQRALVRHVEVEQRAALSRRLEEWARRPNMLQYLGAEHDIEAARIGVGECTGSNVESGPLACGFCDLREIFDTDIGEAEPGKCSSPRRQAAADFQNGCHRAPQGLFVEREASAGHSRSNGFLSINRGARMVPEGLMTFNHVVLGFSKDERATQALEYPERSCRQILRWSRASGARRQLVQPSRGQVLHPTPLPHPGLPAKRSRPTSLPSTGEQ